MSAAGGECGLAECASRFGPCGRTICHGGPSDSPASVLPAPLGAVAYLQEALPRAPSFTLSGSGYPMCFRPNNGRPARLPLDVHFCVMSGFQWAFAGCCCTAVRWPGTRTCRIRGERPFFDGLSGWAWAPSSGSGRALSRKSRLLRAIPGASCGASRGSVSRCFMSRASGRSSGGRHERSDRESFPSLQKNHGCGMEFRI